MLYGSFSYGNFLLIFNNKMAAARKCSYSFEADSNNQWTVGESDL